jgi:hypothetical protein
MMMIQHQHINNRKNNLSNLQIHKIHKVEDNRKNKKQENRYGLHQEIHLHHIIMDLQQIHRLKMQILKKSIFFFFFYETGIMRKEICRHWDCNESMQERNYGWRCGVQHPRPSSRG